jgi:phage terminase Nu1 subunit (DNA packaging protein)
MSATVVSINQRKLLTKRELADYLKRSERWIELHQKEDGLPVAERDRFGHNLYSLDEVKVWLKSPKKPSTAEQVEQLQREVQELREFVIGRLGSDDRSQG